MAAAINATDICGLHERVDENDFKYTFPLRVGDVLTVLGGCGIFIGHVSLQEP